MVLRVLAGTGRGSAAISAPAARGAALGCAVDVGGAQGAYGLQASNTLRREGESLPLGGGSAATCGSTETKLIKTLHRNSRQKLK